MPRPSVVLFVLFLFYFFSPSLLQGIPKSCSGYNQPNLSPIISSQPVLVNTTPHGELYMYMGISPPLRVLHLTGTPYEMGYAAGKLLSDVLPSLLSQTEQWFVASVDSYISWLPKYFQEIVVEVGMAAALDLEILATEAYTPGYFIQELHGLADGSGVSYSTLYQINLLPELIRAQCSMFGAWSSAVPDSMSLLQLRSLDWATNGPFQQWPLVTVYNPQGSVGGHPFATLGWPGFVGALTGFSSAPVAVSQKVWDGFNGTFNRFGVPFNFLLRDILQFDRDVDAALARISNAERTCAIFVGVGQAASKASPTEATNFVAVEYSYEFLNFLDWRNFPVYQNHPKFPGIVYIDKHPQPSAHSCFGDLMKLNYGNITAANTAKYITSGERTGDMHIGIMDFAAKSMYVSNAGVYDASTNYAAPAYSRQFVKVDLAAMFG